MANLTFAPDSLADLVSGNLSDPFAVLGRHGDEIRVFAPGAGAVDVVRRSDDAVIGSLSATDNGELFSGRVIDPAPYKLRIDWGGITQETEDPYSFGLLLGDLDVHLIAEGRHRELANCLGAHAMRIEGIDGVRFAVWAPNASRVSVIGDFNSWDGRRHPMRRRIEAGLWEIFIPRLRPGALYKFELRDAWGHTLPAKADPVALQAEVPPATASIVADPMPFLWTDDDWRARADGAALRKPVSIYEVHVASWIRVDGHVPDWAELADRLVAYVTGMGFTHVEFMPVMHHPFRGSWGYQPLGQFCPTADMGSPTDLAALINRMHGAGIGVILDWVPAHFPTDSHGLAHFDGTALYEHANPFEGFHPDWNTLIYNLGRNEVRGFLIASALHWLEHFHVDGLRVDAVASMLYRDYSRKSGEWIPNQHGGRENLEAVSFLRELSLIVTERCPNALLIAEESTAWPGVTASPDQGGLGFNFKWNMGWMHDTLAYIANDPIYRSYQYDQMTFGLVYAFSERFVLPLSHDEVVHGKRSLLGRMPGDNWQRFANLRAYYGFMWGHPGKKLMFMGCEFAQEREWNHDSSLDWHLLDAPAHGGVQRLIRDLNLVYRDNAALHVLDADSAGFQWVIGDDRDQSVYAFLRLAPGAAAVLVVCNFTPVPRYDYLLTVPASGRWQEIINTDAEIYGGSGMGNDGAAFANHLLEHGQNGSLRLILPPLSTIILRQD
jgi:1,4-alpha-glucan branching enzyme